MWVKAGHIGKQCDAERKSHGAVFTFFRSEQGRSREPLRSKGAKERNWEHRLSDKLGEWGYRGSESTKTALEEQR